jgi:GNAT superfamily N-acetyltransferase
MKYTLNKHIRWRKESSEILICDCKRMIDFKVSLTYLDFLKNLDRGTEENSLDKENKKLFSDLKKVNFLSKIEVKEIDKKDFSTSMKILDEELGKERVRKKEFLLKKFGEFPYLFRGIYLDEEIKGIICGFPRENYLLLSELSVKEPFHGRGFGRLLVEDFENVAKEKKFSQINAGAQDNAIGFYFAMNYKPFLLIQFKSSDYKKEDFSNFEILSYVEDNFDRRIAVKVRKEASLTELKHLREKFPLANFQYIFTKLLN